MISYGKIRRALFYWIRIVSLMLLDAGLVALAIYIGLWLRLDPGINESFLSKLPAHKPAIRPGGGSQHVF